MYFGISQKPLIDFSSSIYWILSLMHHHVNQGKQIEFHEVTKYRSEIMVRLMLAAMVTILIGTTATLPAFANETDADSNAAQDEVVTNVTPFKLVSLAYRGQLEGLSGYNSLLNDVQFGEISGKDIVQYGIDSGKLSAETINNSGYIEVVDNKLQDLLRD